MLPRDGGDRQETVSGDAQLVTEVTRNASPWEVEAGSRELKISLGHTAILSK